VEKFQRNPGFFQPFHRACP